MAISLTNAGMDILITYRIPEETYKARGEERRKKSQGIGPGCISCIYKKGILMTAKFDKKDVFPFDFNGKPLTSFMSENGEPWFVAKEVSSILDYPKTSDALDGLDSDEKDKFKIHGQGMWGNTNIINESGLYSLIFHSAKPEAVDFKKWVMSEVLPTIRKCWGNRAGVPKEGMADEELVLIFADTIVEQRGKIQSLKDGTARLKQDLSSEREKIIALEKERSLLVEQKEVLEKRLAGVQCALDGLSVVNSIRPVENLFSF